MKQEEPKQETLEEVANKNNGYLLYAKDTKAPIFNEGFIAGYQLAQQQNKNLYSEEEVFELTLKSLDLGIGIRQDQLNGYSEKSGKEIHKKWFEQFKKQ